METKHKFVFGTIVCDGCACRIDSNDHYSEILRDIDDLLDWFLEYKGWKEYKQGKWYCPDCAKDPSHRQHPNEGRIIREREILYGLRCDHCGNKFEDYEGLSCFTDSSYTTDRATENDWNEFGDKDLCPDCWEECKAIQAEEDGRDGELYCIDCPKKDYCDETEIRVIPKPSYECKTALQDQKGHYNEKCPFYEQRGNQAEKCTCPADEKCPRLLKWEKEKKRIEHENEEVEKWAKEKWDSPLQTENLK